MEEEAVFYGNLNNCNGEIIPAAFSLQLHSVTEEENVIISTIQILRFANKSNNMLILILDTFKQFTFCNYLPYYIYRVSTGIYVKNHLKSVSINGEPILI